MWTLCPPRNPSFNYSCTSAWFMHQGTNSALSYSPYIREEVHVNHYSGPWNKLSPRIALCRGREAAQDGSAFLPRALPCSCTVPSACIPCPVTALGHCPWPSWLQLQRSIAAGSPKPSVSLSDATPPKSDAFLTGDLVMMGFLNGIFREVLLCCNWAYLCLKYFS